MLGRLWVLFPIFLARTMNTNIEKIFLCSEVEINGQNSDDQTDFSDDFILADTYCAVAPDESSPESV